MISIATSLRQPRNKIILSMMILFLLFTQFFGHHIHVPTGHHETVDDHIDQIEIHYSKFLFFDQQAHSPITDNHTHTDLTEIEVFSSGLIKKAPSILDGLVFLIILTILRIPLSPSRPKWLVVRVHSFARSKYYYFNPLLRAPPR